MRVAVAEVARFFGISPALPSYPDSCEFGYLVIHPVVAEVAKRWSFPRTLPTHPIFCEFGDGRFWL